MSSTPVPELQPPTPAEAPPAAPAPTPTRALAPSDEKTWAVLTHLSPLLGFVTGVLFLAPVVAYLALRDKGPFIRHHTAEALNSLISYGIYTIVATAAAALVTVLTWGLGFGTLVVAGIAPVVAAVLWVVAAVEAGNGRWYRYPLVLRFVR